MSPLTRIFPLVPLLLSPIITNALPLDERDTTTVFVSGPVATSYPQPASAIPGFPIHSSCNATERNQLEKALGDTIKLAQTAAQYVETNGNSSTLYQKYFGSAPTAEVIGWYEKVVHGQREGILFRCDDIDGNCHQEGELGWALARRKRDPRDRHLPLSYSTRQPLEALCGGGYTVSNGALNHYFASDLLHRLYHVTSIGEGAVEHYADSYAECLELAESEPSEAVRNSHTLQYFALEVYAFEVAAPGEGVRASRRRRRRALLRAPRPPQRQRQHQRQPSDDVEHCGRYDGVCGFGSAVGDCIWYYQRCCGEHDSRCYVGNKTDHEITGMSHSRGRRGALCVSIEVLE
ncbi:Prenylated Rab acceptor protein 1 [Taxawa tesnikishii (nom. ined.)]|nr:Prenylated Rab acceptor protein 1 [Dothideales sp. JES 119]